jgi:hypothetical protein
VGLLLHRRSRLNPLEKVHISRKMATISVGNVIPAGTFKYVPYTSDLDDRVSFSD